MHRFPCLDTCVYFADGRCTLDESSVDVPSHGACVHVIPAAAASAQRRPVNSKEKSRGNFSAPLRRAVNAVSTAAKACSGSVPPICGKNSEQRRAAPIQIYCRTKAGPVPISVPPRKNNL